MKIELTNILIKDLIEDYKDGKEDGGVYGYKDKLNIRPAYQREFIYNIDDKKAVIKTVLSNFPLNSIYWVKNDNDKYEVLDGQQRIMSICDFCHNKFQFKGFYFSGLSEKEKQDILEYKLMVYICEGNDKEKLDWFRIINIAGQVLLEQELRNAVYTGEWLTDAKQYFSKNSCPAYNIGKDYLSGVAIRQEYLETVLGWITNNNKDDSIREYMGEHQRDKDANELWQYFQDVINWVKKIFPEYRKEMKGLEWGIFYNNYKNNKYNSVELENKIEMLMEDEEVSNKKGIYKFLLSGEEKHLNLRTFSDKMKREYFEKHKILNKNNDYICKCIKCKKELLLEECAADHIIPWSKGGKTSEDNLQFLCKRCNGIKSNK